MNLYQTQHPFYCGIDLHAKEMYACVVDQNGNKLLHQNFKTRQPEKLCEKLAPYGIEVVVGCESTFNWYWLCDWRTASAAPDELRQMFEAATLESAGKPPPPSWDAVS